MNIVIDSARRVIGYNIPAPPGYTSVTLTAPQEAKFLSTLPNPVRFMTDGNFYLEVPALSTARCFYAHRAGVAQPLYNARYTRIMCTHTDMNDEGLFDVNTARWIAPCPGRLNLSGHIFITNGLQLNGSPPCIKFILNSTTEAPGQAPDGADTFAVVGNNVYNLPAGMGVASGSGWWHVNTGDKIEMALTTFSADGVNSVWLDGHRAHTYFTGAFFPSVVLQRV